MKLIQITHEDIPCPTNLARIFRSLNMTIYSTSEKKNPPTALTLYLREK